MIGDKVRELRLAKGWSMARVDREANLTHGHCRLIESGRRTDVTLETARSIAEAFGVTLDELVSNG